MVYAQMLVGAKPVLTVRIEKPPKFWASMGREISLLTSAKPTKIRACTTVNKLAIFFSLRDEDTYAHSENYCRTTHFARREGEV